MNDLIRLISMALCAFSIGLLVMLIWKFRKAKLDPNDIMLRPMLLIALGQIMTAVFVFSYLIGRLGHPNLIWWTPLAILCYGLKITGLALLNLRFRAMLASSDKANPLKLTVTETHPIGPDKDLTPPQSEVTSKE